MNNEKSGCGKLKSRTWSTFGLLALLLFVGLGVVAGAAYLITELNHSTTVTIKTNGTNVSIEYPIWSMVPSTMVGEMRQKALADVEDDTSTVGSIQADMQNIAKYYNYTVQVKIVSQYGENQLPMPATVKGTSMVPTLKDGQQIVVLKTKDIKVGDLVVSHHPDYNLIVKRVAAIQGDQVYLRSDNRQVEYLGNQVQNINGVERVVTIERRPLDTWVPKSYIVGVVKVY